MKYIKYVLVIFICLIWVFGFGSLFIFVVGADIEKCDRTNSLDYMATSQIEGFNSEWTLYAGNQTGSQVKSLISRLVSNANTYEEDIIWIPNVEYVSGNKNDEIKIFKEMDSSSFTVTEGNVEEYQQYLNNLLVKFDSKHVYWISTRMGTNGIVNCITIYYNKEDSLNE